MSNTNDIALLEQFLGRLNRGDLESIKEYMARDFFGYTPKDDEPTGTDVFYEIVSGIKGAVSDLSINAQDLRSDGDVIRGQMVVSGTHDGGLWGGPASGSQISWPVNVAVRPIEGKFALSLENLSMPDTIGVLRQLGLVNPPDQMDQPAKYPIRMPEIVMKLVFTGQAADRACSHLDSIKVTEPATDVCQDCVALGDIWPALRMCLTCGYVGCCDTSKNKHMKEHFQQTGHPLFRSIHQDESWVWCYEDNAFFSGRLLEKYR